MTIGADLDGVLCLGTIDRKACVPFRLHEYYRTCDYTGLLSDKENLVIITGRKEHFRKVTEEWLEKNKIQYKTLLMLPNGKWKTKGRQLSHKARWISEYGVKEYFEDDEEIARDLRILCPRVRIVHVNLEKQEAKDLNNRTNISI